MKKINRYLLPSALCICGAVAGLGSSVLVSAAVPVEESVEDVRQDSVPRPVIEQTINEPRPAPAPRSLEIPPTIEPTPRAETVADGSAKVLSSPATNTAQFPSGEGSQLAELFYQLQLLQREVLNLRGQVEEQTYLVKRLQRDQKEQYLDLDRRLVAVSASQPAPGPVSTLPGVADDGAPVTANLSERESYNAAFEAMRAREFDRSLLGFQNLIERFPNGKYTPNAYYWIGELYSVDETDLELARQSFMQVASLYPDHQKAPDAQYKLGVVYHKLGDTETAKQYLERVQETYPGTSAANLAQKYAAELQ